MPEKTTATPIVDYFVKIRRKKNTKLDAIDQLIRVQKLQFFCIYEHYTAISK